MIKIICVGKIKEKFYREAIEEYKKRLSKYTKIEIIELKDEDKGSILEKERDSILSKIDKKDYIITLQIEGNNISSSEMATKIENIFITNPNITFIIGGSYGLHDDIKNLSNYKLSFSKMTFPHQLIRVFLLEQLFRAFKISKGETYHW